MCSIAKNQHKHLSVRSYKHTGALTSSTMAAQSSPCDVIIGQPVYNPAAQEVCVHVVISSRKFDTIPKSTLCALVPANLFAKNTVAPSTCVQVQGTHKKSRCNMVFNSSTSAALPVAAPVGCVEASSANWCLVSIIHGSPSDPV